jgi:putative endonuclease
MALVYTEVCRDKSEALRQERLIKKLKKSAKECLVGRRLINLTDRFPSGRSVGC